MKKSSNSSSTASVGEVLQVEIENQNSNNEGISRLDELVIFVKGAKKGERCRVRIMEVKRTYAIAEKI